MTLQDKLLLVYTVATVVQVIVVAISVVFIYWQARETRRSVEGIEKAGRLEIYLRHRHDAQEINRLLLADEEVRQLLGFEKQDSLGFLFLGHAETMFRFKQEGNMSDEVWSSMQKLMEKIGAMHFVVALWPRVRHEYTKDFREHIDRLLAVPGHGSAQDAL